jgi:hypothetical protein
MPTPAGAISIQDVRNFFWNGAGPTDMSALWAVIAHVGTGINVSMSQMRNIGVATAPVYTNTVQTGGLAGTGYNQIQATVASGAAMRANLTTPSPGSAALVPVTMQFNTITSFTGGPSIFTISHGVGQAYTTVDMRWGVAKNI